MKVSIKSFDVDMSVKNAGIEFQVYDNNGTFLGDCILTKTGLNWCKGRKRRQNAKRITWEDFIDYMDSK